ncbi:hypothetical protein ACFQ07_00130 [Actinomadura adrarensis]|uniref:ABC transporter permease n=1 Tax=Actinomadura adrarensis TaxID=1819600 RepID=A0ABW3C809_9ACTN
MTLLQGRCAFRLGEIVVSDAALRELGWRLGTRAPSRLRGPDGESLTLTVVGVYRVQDARDPYWYGTSLEPAQQGPELLDPFFASEEMAFGAALRPEEGAPPFVGRVLLLLKTDQLTSDDVAAVGESVRRIESVADSYGPTSLFHTTLGQTLEEVRAGIGTLSVSILVISVQLVVLCWLLLVLRGDGRGRVSDG